MFTTYPHETKGPGERGERCSAVFWAWRTQIANRVGAMHSFPTIDFGISQIGFGISQKSFGINFGISQNRRWDLLSIPWDRSGISTKNTQDVGITFF